MYVLVATVSYGETGMTGWQAVVVEACGDPSTPLFALSFIQTHTHTHTHTTPREFRRKLLPGHPKMAGFLRRWKSLSRATQQRTLPLGDSALSSGFDAYRSVGSPREC